MDPTGAPQKAPFQPTRAPRRRSRVRRAVAAFLVTITLAQLVAVAGLYGFAAAYEGRVFPNVSVAGISLSGLDRTQAEARLRSLLLPLSTGYLTLRVGEHQFSIPYRDLGRDYDMTWTLNQAFAIGHTGGPPAMAGDGIRSLMNPTDLGIRATFDPVKVAQKLAEATASLRIEPTSARLTLSKDGSKFRLASATEGRDIDLTAATARVLAVVGSTSAADATVDLVPVAITPATTTEAAQAVLSQAQALATRIGASDLKLTGAGREFKIPAATIRRWIRFTKQPDGSYTTKIQKAMLTAEVARIAKQVYIAPRNAQLLITGSSAFGYIDSANGRKVETGPTISAALAALEGRATGAGAKTVKMPVVTLTPAITSEEAARVAPHMVLLGGWTTPYVPSIRNYYGANIRIPAATINGTVLAPGEWFDFWKAVGDVSRSTGYGDGGVIRNGRTYPTGALAGGICSASTTLFNAAARAGLQLGKRHNHYYYITRYPLGLDATVLKGSGGVIQNMTFRNDTDHPLLIRGINSYGRVRFEIYGVPTGRSVSFSAPRVANVAHAYDTVVYTSTLPTGRRERIEYPADGKDVWVTRTVRDGGTVIHQETFYSHYGRVDGVVLVGR
jgi:vancomycin resistance protein YoaR